LVSDLARQLNDAVEVERNNETAVKTTFAEPVYSEQVDLMTKPRILIIEHEILIARELQDRLRGYAMPWSASAVIGGLQVAALAALQFGRVPLYWIAAP
jgi:hypothetical protein